MSALGSRLTKAMRVRSDTVRHVYTAARRAGRIRRDAEQRAALRRLGRCRPTKAGGCEPALERLVLGQ